MLGVMEPTCLMLESNSAGITRIYAGEVSTAHAISLMHADAPVQLLEFGAETSQGAWLSADMMPANAETSEWLALLQADSFALIDFSALIGDVQLSSHDDSEITVTFTSEHEALDFVQLLTPAKAESVTKALVTHKGMYVSLRDEPFRVFATFDAYIAGT